MRKSLYAFLPVGFSGREGTGFKMFYVIKAEELKKKGGLVSPVCESTAAIKRIESNSWMRNIFSLHDQKNIDENTKKDFLMRQISGGDVNKARL